MMSYWTAFPLSPVTMVRCAEYSAVSRLSRRKASSYSFLMRLRISRALGAERGFESGELNLDFLNLGRFVGVGGVKFGDLALQFGQLGLVIAEGGVVEHVGERIGGTGVGHFPARLFGDAVGLSGGESLLELKQLVLGNVVLRDRR